MAEEFKLDDRYHSRYARLLMAEDPDLSDNDRKTAFSETGPSRSGSGPPLSQNAT
jgi:hypothetical protein